MDAEREDVQDQKVVEDTVVQARNGTYGVKPRLERYLGFLPLIAFSSVLQCSWESLGGGLLAGLLNGGPVALVYGLILSVLGSTAISASLGELASITPVAGAQYHWTFDLAPVAPRFFCLMQGWLTVFAWLATAAIAPFLVGTQIQGLIILNYDSYVPQRWHGTLLFWAVMIIPFTVNIFARKLLAPIEITGGICHLVFFPIVLATILSLGPRSPSSFVWTEFVSGISGWDNKGVAWSVGLLAVTFPLGGFDGVLHMSEEAKRAAGNIPLAMVLGTAINGIMAFGFIVAILYSMGSFEDALNSPTGYPIIEIYYQATKSKAATNTLMALGIIIGFYALFSILASVSRLTWAFARDNGLPFSGFFAKVSPNLKIPLRALILVTIVCILLSLINIGSTTAFNAILSLSTLALYLSYLLPIIFLLIRRFRGPPIQWGPFHLGRFGLPVNIFSILYGVYIIVFLPFPPELPVTAVNLNYAGPVMGAVLLFAILDWCVRGRKTFLGPTVKVAEERVVNSSGQEL